MSTSVPGPNGLLVGAKGEGTAFQNIRIVSASITPGAVSATAAVYSATVAGISASLDNVVLLATPTQSGLGAVCVAATVGDNDGFVKLWFAGPDATAVTPNPGTFKFLVFRKGIY